MRAFKSLRGSPVQTKVFLGGTCNGTDWREKVKEKISVSFFDPVVSGRDWTDEDASREVDERAYFCTHMCYVITPRTKGLYAISELMEDSILRSERTIVCFLKEDGDATFSDEQWKSNEAIMDSVRKYHHRVFTDLDEVIGCINNL